ncbi:MAG TPA: hypothetical protein PKD37_00780 [Oligoflexia bacterium]|nr:hypothetical protein [Oligoflexia bacterium]HMP26514.1 hypothetical protein [Oligoflexia bacterium]
MDNYTTPRTKSRASNKLEVTMGDLIEVVSQIALRAGKTEEEGYLLASLALSDMLSRPMQKRGRKKILK